MGEDEEGDEAELSGASARRGVAGRRGYGERRRRAPFGRGREREQRGIGTEGETRESERGSRASAWRSGDVQGEEEAARQGGGGRGAWPRAPGACPSFWQGRKATGGVAVAGWADSAGPPGGWASGKRQVSFLCSVFYFFSSVLFYLILLPLF